MTENPTPQPWTQEPITPTPEQPTRRRWLVPVLATTGAVVVVALAVVTTLLVTKQDAPPATSAAATTTHTVHPVPVPETRSAPTADDGGLFDKFMRDEGFTVYASIDDLNGLAAAVCTGFDAGLSMAQMLDSVGKVGWGSAMSGRFIGFAVASHCPRNAGKTQ